MIGPLAVWPPTPTTRGYSYYFPKKDYYEAINPWGCLTDGGGPGRPIMEMKIYCGSAVMKNAFLPGEDWSTMRHNLSCFRDLASAVAAFWLQNPRESRVVLEK